MSKILNETTIYPGWDISTSEMATEEKALLITSRQNFIFSYAKTGAVLGFLISIYNIFVKLDIKEEQFNFSFLLILMSFYVFAAGLIGYLLGLFFAKIYKK